MSNFRPMGVDPAGWNFGLDKLNRELDRHQFIRELTQNAIEAVQQTESGTGEVTWELYPLEVGGQTVNKLCCIDNGIGMTGEELVDYINTGFRSGKERGHKANFGIGAKVSALTFNKAGVLYLSWRGGEGAMIHLSQNADGFYGLNRLERPDGTYGWWAPIGDERKPEMIKGHGTVVVLMGDTPDEDTFSRPKGSELPMAAWVGVYLQRKYFAFPDGITVRVRRQGLERDNRDGAPRRHIMIIRGQRSLLEREALENGTVEAGGAKVRYYLLPKKVRGESGDALKTTTGHVAALHQDELYEPRYGTRGGYQRLGSFGVMTGKQRVVIYVEPDSERVEANLTRQQLLVDGERFPWDKYAAEFSENMPDAIKNMMHELLEAADGRTSYEKLLERLKILKAMMEPAHRYGTSEEGDVRAEVPTVGGDPRELDRPQEDKNPSGGFGGLRSHIDRLIQSAKGEKAKKKNTKHQPPEVIWVSVAAGTRARGDLEDRAASYDPIHNQITANKDFRNFKRVVKAIHQAVPQSNGSAEAAAELEFGLVLVETVLNLKAMEGSPEWSSEEIKAQFSPEAMTNCVNHSFHLMKAANEEVRRQIKAANEK